MLLLSLVVVDGRSKHTVHYDCRALAAIKLLDCVSGSTIGRLPDAMDLGAVLSAAAQAVAQMLVLASAGAFLELTGQLGPTKRAALSNVAFRVFLPALLFTNVAESASAEAMRRQWPLLGYSAMYVCVGYAIGAVLAPRLVAKSDEFSRTHFIFSCALNNVGYLPLILVPATIAQGALHPPGTNIATEIKRGTSHIGKKRVALP